MESFYKKSPSRSVPASLLFLLRNGEGPGYGTMSYESEKVRVLVVQWCLTLCDPMDVAHQAPLSMEFSRQEYWSVLPFPSPGDLSDPGIESGLPHYRHILFCLNHQGKWDYDGLLSPSNVFVPREFKGT